RHPLALGNFLEEDRMRRTHRVDGLAGRRERTIRSGAPAEQVDLGPYHELLDLGDLVIHDLEPKRDRDEIALAVVHAGIREVLAHRADERDLLRLDVGHVELVTAVTGHAVPQAFVAERELDAVLREARADRKELRARIVREHRFEVAIDVALETRA